MATHRSTKRAQKKVGIALSGGSTWGIAHVGVLKALEEEGIPIDEAAGTSAGSLVAACYAFGMPIDQMAEAARTMDWKKLSRFGYSRLGLRSNAPMEGYLTELIGDVRIEDSKIPLAIVAADIETHEKVVLTEGNLARAVRASTAIPGYFMPVQLEGKMLVDGAVAENLPIPTVRTLGADVVIAVNLSGRPGGRRPRHLLSVLVSSLSALSYHHDRALALGADVLIEPDLSAFDASKFKDAEVILEAGYAAAKAAMPALREKLGLGARQGVFAYLVSFFRK